MTVLWKAIDGREFIIEADTLEEVYEAIAELRKQYNIATPDCMTAAGDVDQFPDSHTAIRAEELSEDIQEALKEQFEESLAKPDPKKLN